MTTEQLQSWKCKQRNAYRNGTLSNYRRRKLEEIQGWYWNLDIPNYREQLLQMAANGEPKPLVATSIGNALSRYTKKKKTKVGFDAEFNDKIRLAAPHWFQKSSSINKTILLKMAKDGEPRPNKKSTLGRCLNSYVSKNKRTYDAKFETKIRKIGENWFFTTSENKAALLKMATEGTEKPHYSTRMGSLLADYTNVRGLKSDVEFNRKIRAVAPHWFVYKRRVA